MSTTKLAQLTGTVLAATAVAFLLGIAWTAWFPVETGSGAAPAGVVTRGSGGHNPDARRRETVSAEATQPDPMSRGLVTGLDAVLFTSGMAELQPAAIGNLDRLVAFLARYHDRSVSIRGYADSVGNEEDNQELSERRANSVKAYLVGKGIEPTRLAAVGKGQSDPIAGNDSRAGRQQNRRAEVIINDLPATVPPRTGKERAIALLMLLQSVSGHSERPSL